MGNELRKRPSSTSSGRVQDVDVDDMRISLVEVSDFKRARCVSFRPKRTGTTTIGGRNAQGKTSVLNAIALAVGGTRLFMPSQPNNTESENDFHIKVKMECGLQLERKGDKHKLYITDPNGKLTGQEMLDMVFSSIALDVSRFINQSEKEKTGALLQVLGPKVATELERIDKAEETLYEERHECGIKKDIKKKAALDMPCFMDVGDVEKSISELLQDHDKILKRNAQVQVALDKIEQNKQKLVGYQEQDKKLDEQKSMLLRQIEQINSQIATLDKQKSMLGSQMDEISEEIVSAEESKPEKEDTTVIEEQIKNFSEYNRKVKANADRKACQEEANKLEFIYKEYDAKINDVRNQRKLLLEGANLPYPGLSVQNGVLTLDGKNWDCISGSQKMSVACAIVSKLRPHCKFLLVDGLEQKDDEQRDALNKWAIENDCQIIGTVVDSRPEACSLIIEDGEVAVDNVSGTDETCRDVVEGVQDAQGDDSVDESSNLPSESLSSPEAIPDGEDVQSAEVLHTETVSDDDPIALARARIAAKRAQIAAGSGS